MTHPNEKAYWAAVRSDFKTFLVQAYRTVYPGKEFQDNWHIDAIVYHLRLGFEGKLPRLIINLPPRHLKSFIVSVAWPAFILGQDPAARIIGVTYSDDLAKTMSSDFRRLVESDWYLRVFDNVQFTKMVENEVITSKGGGRYGTSVGGTLTGRGGDFIIVDDPIKPADAASDKARTTNNEWFTNTLLSRLDDKEHGVLILVMQRLHVMDLTAHAMSMGSFHRLAFPAIAIEDAEIPLNDDEVYVREVGEPLNPARESAELLARMRREMGLRTFAAQYQQDPEAADGAIFLKKDLCVVEGLPKQQPDGFYWVSIDAAASLNESASYTSITIGWSDHTGHNIYKNERGHWTFEELLDKTLFYKKALENPRFVIERASNGIPLIHSLRARQISWVHWHTPTQSKIERASNVQALFTESLVRFVRRGEGHDAWIEPMLAELMAFPNGKHDDQVDSLVQGLRYAEPRVRSLPHKLRND